MTSISVQNFIGEQPRVIARLMPDTAAQSAVNVRLDDGGLTPIRKSITEDLNGAVSWRSVYKNGSEWLGWNDVVHAAPGPVATDRLYFTGDGVPKMRVSVTNYPLAISAPTTALTVGTAGVGSGDVTTRLYVYTWVTDFGEESEPCPASASIAFQNGITVTLSGFEATPSGRNITKQRIYRSQTGQTGTYFYLIHERTATTGNYIDTVNPDQFQEPLPSASWNPPPDTLAGLISMPNGMMAAYDGKKLYFCEPFHPHAWPEKYILTTDFDIVGLGAIGSSLLVMTTGKPYLVTGSAPETMQPIKIEQNLPCLCATGIVDLGYAIAYPSHEGLVVVEASGQWKLATRNIFNREDWLALSPDTFVGGHWGGRYVAFYSKTEADGYVNAGTLMIDTGGEGFLTRTDTVSRAAFYDIPSSSLFYVDQATGYILKFDDETAARRTLYWKSKEYVLTRPENFAGILIETNDPLSLSEEEAIATEIAATKAANAALIAAGPLGGAVNAAPVNAYAVNGHNLAELPDAAYDIMAVNVYADGTLIHTTSKINRVVRLPGNKSARRWEFDVYSNIQVERVAMATTIDELKVTP